MFKRVVFLAIFFATKATFACSCVVGFSEDGAKQVFERATTISVVKVVALLDADGNASNDQYVSAELDVIEHVKGTPEKSLLAKTTPNICMENLKVGTEYLVYTFVDGEPFEIGYCGAFRLSAAVHSDLLLLRKARDSNVGPQ